MSVQKIPHILIDSSLTGAAGKIPIGNSSGKLDSSWISVSLPDQTGNSGKYLTTDGTTASWATDSFSSWDKDYDDLTNKPTIPVVPTTVSSFTNDAGYITGVTWNDVTNKPTLFSGSYNDLTDKPDLTLKANVSDLAAVATSGDYEDLINTPTIPTVPTNVSDFTNDAGYITGVSWAEVTSKPTFATVATSGDYEDLSNTPTIPTVPTNVSDFTNDAGYITGVAWGDITGKPSTFTPAEHNHDGVYAPLASPALTGTPTAPTATAGTNSTQIATTAYVDGAVSSLVNSAPTTLDTLNELASALGNDPNFATTVATEIGGKLDSDSANYVKSLSISGQTITVTKGNNSTSTLTTQDTVYILPKASSETLGGIKVGSNLSINSTGVLSATSQLPSQTSNSGKYLTTNGTTVSWATIPTYSVVTASANGLAPKLPGTNDKYLRSDGTWAVIPNELPSQSNNSGKFLTTNGTAVSWTDVDALPSQTGNSGKFLTTDGTDASWADILATEIKLSSVHYPSFGDTTVTLTSSESIPSDVNKYAIAVYRDGIYLNPSLDYGFNSSTRVITFSRAFETDEVVTVIFTYISSDTQAVINLDVDEYEAGTGITFTENAVTGKVTINAGDTLPAQTNNSGKFLTTNGTTASWAALPVVETLTTSEVEDIFDTALGLSNS